MFSVSLFSRWNDKRWSFSSPAPNRAENLSSLCDVTQGALLPVGQLTSKPPQQSCCTQIQDSKMETIQIPSCPILDSYSILSPGGWLQYKASVQKFWVNLMTWNGWWLTAHDTVQEVLSWQPPATTPAVFHLRQTHNSVFLLTLLSVYFSPSGLCTLFSCFSFAFCFLFFLNSRGLVSPAGLQGLVFSPCRGSVHVVPPLAGLHARTHREKRERANKQTNSRRQTDATQREGGEREWSDAASHANIHNKKKTKNPRDKFCMLGDEDLGFLDLLSVGAAGGRKRLSPWRCYNDRRLSLRDQNTVLARI